MLPQYKDMYKDFLFILKDGKEHDRKEIQNRLAIVFNLTEEELSKMVPSGQKSMFHNRVSWAQTCLKKAGLIDYPSRGVYVITERGRKALLDNPIPFDNTYLNQFPEFVEFNSPKTTITVNPLVKDQILNSSTPEESIDQAYEQIISSLADEILIEVNKISPKSFEQLVVDLLMAMGYGDSLSANGFVTTYVCDEGIDGIIKEDKLGFDNIYIQAKKWDINNTIGRPEIQKFAGALLGQGGTKGLFITTSKFSKDAIDYANKSLTSKIVLVDGTQLAKLMIDHNLGVSIVNTYTIKRVDSDYFTEK